MEKTNFKILSVGQIGIRVGDLDRATIFYRDVLGLELVLQVPGMMSFFDLGETRLMLAVPTSAEYDHPSSVIYYRVEDIYQSHEALKSSGVAFTQNPHSVGQIGDVDVWMAFFEDTEGNTVAILAEMPFSPTV